MPRYFFNIFNDETKLDAEGRELPHIDAAREEALEAARALVCESVRKGHLNLDHHIEVKDETGQEVLSVTFREAFTVEG